MRNDTVLATAGSAGLVAASSAANGAANGADRKKPRSGRPQIEAAVDAEIKTLVRRLRDGLEERPVVVSSGFRAIDSLLPDGGIRRGSLIEWLLPGMEAASGGITLASAVAVRGLQSSSVGPAVCDSGMPRQVVIVVDRRGRFHPPAVFPWMGFYPLTGGREYRCDRSGCRLVVVRPSNDDDETWAIDQSLRCSGVKAVVAWPRRIHPTAMRRWQLAARSSGSVGLIARPVADRREPSWAHVRLVVSPVAGGGAGVRVFRVSLTSQVSITAGPIDFGERSATVSLEVSSSLERSAPEMSIAPEMKQAAVKQLAVKQLNVERVSMERLQCHAS